MALVLLTIGIVLTIEHPTSAVAVESQASSLRLGVLCCLIWLAYPELIKIPGWLFPALACTGLAVFRWPRLFALVPIIAAGGWLLQPRGKNRRRVASRSHRREPSPPRDV